MECGKSNTRRGWRSLSLRASRAAEILTKNMTMAKQPAFYVADSLNHVRLQTSETTMIEVRNLTKRYGDLLAIRDISFTAATGQILGFLGPNGAGKTTTMRIITGFMPATSGTVKVEGYDIFDDSYEVRKRIGYLPESPPLYNDMTVTGYLRFVGRIRGISKAELNHSLDRALRTCGLAEVTGRVVGHLSKGFRQRVGLAQALIHNPSVLVLDEPTIGLDPRQIIDIRTLIQELASERTVILSTHILPEVAQLCEKVVIINEGRIAVEDTLANLTQGASLEEVFLRSIGKEAEDMAQAAEGAGA
jgi:ABC-2 type transport system ATP-binding protein